ncbi:MAG TPA: DNA polymerase III subunit delta [Spirochaetales bacterium]|nr:DNA polymerase III subunit delta [Spirochaetales bacterium]
MESVIVVGGPELGRRNDFLAQLKTRCAKEWGQSPEEHRLYADETGVTELLDLLMNGSLFSSGKLVYYYRADQIKLKADTQALAAYAKNPADATVLVLVSDGYGVDKLIEDAVPKEHKRVFWELSGSEMEKAVRDQLAAQGIRADQDAVEAILELVENNTEALRTECSRLALFWPKGSAISEDDVERYIAHNRSEDAFSLFERMATGSFEQALDTLAAILANRAGNGVGLIAGLAWSMRRLSAVHDAMAQGSSFEQAARSQRINARKLLATYDAARQRWPRPLCRSLVAFSVETDAQLRQLGQAHERTILELFLYACMVAKAPYCYEALG